VVSESALLSDKTVHLDDGVQVRQVGSGSAAASTHVPARSPCAYIAANRWACATNGLAIIVSDNTLSIARAGLSKISGCRGEVSVHRRTSGQMVRIGALVTALKTRARPKRAATAMAGLILFGSRLCGATAQYGAEMIMRHFLLPENALRGTVLPRHQDVFTSVGGIVTPAAGGIALVLVLVALNRIKTNEQFKAVGGGLKTQREILAMADTPGARVSTRRTQGVSDLERLRMVVRRVGYDFFQAKASKPYERRAEPFAMANQQALQFHSRRLLFGLLYEQGVDAATALRHSAGGGYITTDGMRCLEVDDAIHMPLGGSSRRSILMDTFTRACMAKTDVIAALHDNQSNVFDAAAWADSGSVAADT
jgi:hypothetical protein